MSFIGSLCPAREAAGRDERTMAKRAAWNTVARTRVRPKETEPGIVSGVYFVDPGLPYHNRDEDFCP
jgi:hypothetical protein